jgi:hypothetical protein
MGEVLEGYGLETQSELCKENCGILGFSHFVDIVTNFKPELFRKPNC